MSIFYFLTLILFALFEQNYPMDMDWTQVKRDFYRELARGESTNRFLERLESAHDARSLREVLALHDEVDIRASWKGVVRSCIEDCKFEDCGSDDIEKIYKAGMKGEDSKLCIEVAGRFFYEVYMSNRPTISNEDDTLLIIGKLNQFTSVAEKCEYLRHGSLAQLTHLFERQLPTNLSAEEKNKAISIFLKKMMKLFGLDIYIRAYFSP